MGKRLAIGILLTLLLAVAFPWQAGAAPRPTLRWGSTGSDVCLVQRKLKAWGYYRGVIDCTYGREMYAAVTLFQRRNGLKVDGFVGPQTYYAIGIPTGVTTTAAPTRTATRGIDQELLARVVSAEAKGEPYEGQVAVAAVMLNRIRDSRFPNTLAGVVYQTDAFESVANGTVYTPATASAIRAAQDALNGWDPSGGAVFFWNPATATSPWVWSRPIIKQIGGHVFAK